MTEKNLVGRLRRGDKASFDELFNRYFEQCFTYAVSLLKDPDAAEDVVQNVFLKLWTGRERLDSSKPVKSYLLTAVRNESISWLRAKFVADRERRLVQEPEDETQNRTRYLRSNLMPLFRLQSASCRKSVVKYSRSAGSRGRRWSRLLMR